MREREHASRDRGRSVRGGEEAGIPVPPPPPYFIFSSASSALKRGNKEGKSISLSRRYFRLLWIFKPKILHTILEPNCTGRCSLIVITEGVCLPRTRTTQFLNSIYFKILPIKIFEMIISILFHIRFQTKFIFSSVSSLI